MTNIELDLVKIVAARAENVSILHVNNFDFNLTCDVIGDLEVNKIRFRSSFFPQLSTAVLILKTGPVVSEIGEGLKIAPL